MTRMSTNLLVVSLCLWLPGCATKTVHFDNVPPERVQVAYERIFHAEATPSPSTGVNSGGAGFDVNLSGIGDALARADWIGHLLGIWSTSSEHRWEKGRYSSSNSTWWLIFPVRIESETAVVKKTPTGTNLTLEVYPADDALIADRLQQVQRNIDAQSRQ